MAVQRTRKSKENPHYGFLVSWQPGMPDVKRELQFDKNLASVRITPSKKADIMAQEVSGEAIKKDIFKSLILISLILILELVVYLLRNQKVLP